MGSFRCADVATGLSLGRGDDAVCLVIARRRGGYPDPEKAAATRTHGATDMFEPASMPIRGRVGDHGGFVPAKGQESVKVACNMSGTRDWNDFQERAFDFRGDGIPFGKGMQGAPPARMILGTAFLSAATWKGLTEPYPSQDRQAEVAAVLSALGQLATLDARSRAQGIGTEAAQELKNLVLRNFGLLRLRSSIHVDAEDVTHHMPPLARCLDRTEGGAAFCREFAHWMGDVSGSLGFADGCVVVPSPGLLGGFWDVQQAMLRMRHLGLSLRPSPVVPDNADLVGPFASDVVERAVSAVLDRAEEMDDERGFAVAAKLLARLDGVRGRLAARVEAGLVLHGVAPAGP